MGYEIKEITGYDFNNIAAFNAANATCKTNVGIPVSQDATTQEYISPQRSFKANGDIDFYYYEGDLAPVYGNPTTFDIRTPNTID